MAKETKYYYFRLTIAGKPYAVKVSGIPIDTAIMRYFSDMSDGQVAFYLAHPDASIEEIVACELNPPYVPPAPDLQEYIAQKIKELEEACYGSVSVTSLEFAMAIDKIENPASTACYYNLTKAIQVRDDFRSQSKNAMKVFSTYKPSIEASQSVEAVDEIYEEAIGKL